MRGDNSPSIRSDEIASFLVSIPPIVEQERIVTAIDTTFEQLDSIAVAIV
jgi:restriction endonuclease S subunit